MPLVISHRGANQLAPENTLPAFARSLDFRVDGFENDVHMTRDGRLVVCHDETIDRTSNGSGRIADHTFAQLRDLDFGSWFGPQFAGTKIPSLEEFFALCDSLKIINVEIKRALSGGTESAAEVIRLAKEYHCFDRLILSSFDLDMLRAAKRADANARAAMLYSPNSPEAEAISDDPPAFAKKYGLDALHPFVFFVTPEYIRTCHGAGLLVNPWTVNQETGLARLRDWGTDGIITDFPDLAMRIVYGEDFAEERP
ncbi:MAG: glycerophosphodiester phosphodiesterase [Oscillospiraceae bacterium]|jgi:glycerophosphoryl diester phosphodiesterase|nr:glycerophosphodiester phosphodiesterase [Oscillospiraceae bacterium]